MHFEWDENKNRLNIRKHGINFADITLIFNSPMLVSIDEMNSQLETRWKGVGIVNQLVIVIIYTERKNEVTRIISARKATNRERKLYEKYLQPK